jgi:MFS family permease
VRRDSLWFHRDFRHLWAGDTISQFGQSSGRTALPLLAATVLCASPFQMGLLTAAGNAAFLVLGLPAGVWVDRMRRRPLMLTADLTRAALLVTVPVAWWAGGLTLTQLIAVMLLVGVGTLFFDVAYQSYLPSLVGRAQLVEGNAKLQASQSISQIAGPGIAGGLTQLLGAANTVLTTGAGYLASGLFLWRIKAIESRPGPGRTDRGDHTGEVGDPTAELDNRSSEHSDGKGELDDRNGGHGGGGARLRAGIAEGLRFVFGNPVLRAITLCTASNNFFYGSFLAVEILFFTWNLGLSPAGVGLLLTAGGIGGVLGAMSVGWWTGRAGQVRTIWLVCVVTFPAVVLVPLAAPGWAVVFAPIGLVSLGYGAVVYNVAQVSYRQTVCPDRLLGRMNASVRFVVWGVTPLGGLLGGALGEWIGVHATVWVALLGQNAAILPLLFSPLRTMRDLPSPASDGTPAALA